MIGLTLDIEEKFGIDISDEEWRQAVTIGETYEVVCEKLGRPTADPPDGTPEWEQLLDVIQETTSIRRSVLEYSANFVEDLKLH